MYFLSVRARVSVTENCGIVIVTAVECGPRARDAESFFEFFCGWDRGEWKITLLLRLARASMHWKTCTNTVYLNYARVSDAVVLLLTIYICFFSFLLRVYKMTVITNTTCW